MDPYSAFKKPENRGVVGIERGDSEYSVPAAIDSEAIQPRRSNQFPI
jgi:hypothetical protein